MEDIFEILTLNREKLLCDSVKECSNFNRIEHLDTEWAVWMIKK